jgi:hypothetical protein
MLNERRYILRIASVQQVLPVAVFRVLEVAFLTNVSSTLIDPVFKEILPFLVGQNFLEGIVPRYIPHWLKVAVIPVGIRRPWEMLKN